MSYIKQYIISGLAVFDILGSKQVSLNLIWNMKRYIYIFLSFVLFSSTLPLNISLILGCYGYFERMLSLYNFEHTFIVILSGYQLPFLPAYFILGSNLNKCLFSVCILKAVQILQKANDQLPRIRSILDAFFRKKDKTNHTSFLITFHALLIPHARISLLCISLFYFLLCNFYLFSETRVFIYFL